MKATCAFCGNPFELDEPGGLHIAVFSDRQETTQDLPAHAQCISERLHPGVPFDASTFEPDSDD